MKNIKYANKVVMYLISGGYLILIIAALLLHLNIMYTLAPYALLTFCCINYTYKRSENFVKYWIGFELGLNEKGNFFKFFILASKSNDEIFMIKEHEIEILKVSQYQTGHIINVKSFQVAMAKLKYLVLLPSTDPQIVIRAAATNDNTHIGNTSISSSHYAEILIEYKIFKNAIINLFKQNKSHLLRVTKPPVIPGWKRRNQMTKPSFIRQQA